VSSPIFPEWPPPPGYSAKPVWTGRGFRVGDEAVPVLCYQPQSPAWTGELTAFHEEVSGGAHFIDVASRRQTLNTISRWMPSESAVMLDIGCSSGYMIRDLRQRFPRAAVMGADSVREPLQKLSASMPDVPLLQFDVVECPLPDACVDVVVLLNVLEHIEDDAAAARQVYRVLRPGGIAVVEVPYGPHLFDVYDRQLLHFRRYHTGEIEGILRRAGFEIPEISHLGFFLYPFFRAVKLWNRRFLKEPPGVQRRIVAANIVKSGNSALPGLVMRIEEFLHRWAPFPRGIRCRLTAYKS